MGVGYIITPQEDDKRQGLAVVDFNAGMSLKIHIGIYEQNNKVISLTKLLLRVRNSVTTLFLCMRKL